jgi:ferrochelatase
MKQAHLLVNLGTPNSPRYRDMFRYLAEFLGDKRVVDLPRWLWLPILYGVILPFRSKKSGHTYAQIWDAKRGSPLRYHTKALTKALATSNKLQTTGYAMRYGQPSITATLDKLVKQGHTKIRVTPLYPQYAGATVGTTLDVLANWLKRNLDVHLTVTEPWYSHPAYIDALAKSIRKATRRSPKDVGGPIQAVIVSFHGLPLRTVRCGDPYQKHCETTFRLLKKKLPEVKLLLTYQSRFGKEEWLQPYFDKTVEGLPAKGFKNIAVIAPGFAVDCVETLEELGLRGKESFMKNGGKTYTLIPCLNKAGASVLRALKPKT